MNVLHSNFLLAFAAMAIKRLEQCRGGPRKLVGLVQALTFLTAAGKDVAAVGTGCF